MSPGSPRHVSGELAWEAEVTPALGMLGFLVPSPPEGDSATSSHRYRLTAIAVDHTAGPHQNYTVIFVGSEAGVVLKVLAKTTTFSLNDSVLLEEIEAYNQAK